MNLLVKLNSFKNCQAGNVSMMFAAALLPIAGTIGFAVDFSRSSEVKAQLVAAVDSTALALAHASVNLTDEQLQAKADKIFAGNFKPGTTANSSSVTASRDAGALTVEGSAAFNTSFLRVLNIPTLDVTAKSKVVWGSDRKVEVVLALDNTGSMKGTKLEELKKAANELIDKLEDAAEAAGTSGKVEIGLVPFATTVRVDPNTYKNKKWIRFDKVPDTKQVCTKKKNKNGEWYDDCENVPYLRNFVKQNWQGCIWDRDQPYDIDDTSYDHDQKKAYYPAIQEACPSDEKDLQTVVRLTDNFDTVRGAVNNMKAAGNTNITIGLAWAMSLLSHKEPFAEGTETTGPKAARKYLILLTDGENTKNRFGDNTHGAIDARTEKACEEAGKLGTIFTIRMIDGDEGLLKGCASGVENYYNINVAADVSSAFQAMADEIANLRIAE